MFLVIAFSIILAQGICMQLIAIYYVDGYVGPRSERASSELDTLRDLNNLIKPHIGVEQIGIIVKILRRLFLPQESNVFDDIRQGQCDEDEVKGYAAIIWSTIAGTKPSLHLDDITRRLREMDRDPDRGEELFYLLDESCDGGVSRAELEKLVVTTAVQLKKRAAAMRGIQLLLRKLEFLLTMIVFGAIVFVYTNFFPQSWAKVRTLLIIL